MDSSTEGGVSISNRQRKFGLPNWMVNNIERLNYSTDFEQYACSPPEAESYLTDYMENELSCGMSDNQGIKQEIQAETNKIEPNHERNQPQYLPNQPGRLQPCHSFIESLRHEELYSSPDSTPCATPEPSPVIRRKISIPHPDDTVQTNPGRWFYMGKLKKGMPVPNCILPTGNKENKAVVDGGISRHSDSQQKKSGIKLVISNFDLNAVSPNSW